MMSEKLTGYMKEWKEEVNRPVETSAEIFINDMELESIQRAIAFVYEEEKESLTEQEREEVERILSIEYIS